MAQILTDQDFQNAKIDIEDIGQSVNESMVITPRYGAPYKSIPMLSAEAQVEINNWLAAIQLITQEDGVPALAVSDASGLTQQDINNNLSFIPNSGGSVGAIGGTFRGYVDGVQFIEDTAHAPFGTTGIVKADNYTVRINHAFSASKVGTLTFCPDESFAAMGVIAGASVAQDFSLTKVIAPLYFTCKGDGTITKVSPLFDGSVTLDAASNPSGGILRFNHPLKSVTAHQAIACNRGFVDNVARPLEINVFNNDGGNYTQIQAYEEQVNSVWIKYNGTAFEATQGIRKAEYSFSFNGSTGLLTITHPAVKSGAFLTVPHIQPFQTDKRYSINSISSTTTGVLCRAADGSVVKTPSTADFSFLFEIKPSTRAMSLTSIPATAEFEVFVGNCYVPVDNLKNVASGNIWFYGGMKK